MALIPKRDTLIPEAFRPITRILYAADESEVSVKGTTETERKTHSVIKSSSHSLNIAKLYVIAEMKVSAASTGTLKVYVDGTARIELTTTSTDYELKKGSWTIDPAWDDDSKHAISIRLYNSSADETTYNRLYEIYVEM